MDDFPAAHSMDTEWFAVDADGHVARFDSGEDGAVPNAAAIGFSPGEASFDVDLLRVACLAERIARDPLNEVGPPQGNGRLLVRMDEGYRNAPAPDERFEAIGPLFLSREPMSPAEVKKLAALPNARLFDLDRVLECFEDQPLDGLYEFQRNHGDDPGLYLRSAEPEEPLRLAQLPSKIGGELGSLRLPVHFGDTQDLHLADHLANQDAMYWGDDWALRWPSGPQAGPPPPRSTAVHWRVLLVVLVALAIVVWLVRR